jgi:uncharacterized protein YkwD
MSGLKGLLKSIGEAFRLRPPRPPPVVARPPPAPWPVPDLARIWADGQALLEATNEARLDHGKTPLAYDARLTAAAFRIAADNATRDELSHRGGDGSWPAARIEEAGYAASACSENGFQADPWPGGPDHWGTAEHAVAGWLESTVGHREALLGAWTHTGGARCVASDGTTYWFGCYATPKGGMPGR